MEQKKNTLNGVEISDLGERLERFYKQFSQRFQTQTKNTSEYGLKYISGLLRMETDRYLANVGRKTGVSGQNLQHFMSNSTWSGEEVILAVQKLWMIYMVVIAHCARKMGWNGKPLALAGK